MTGRFERAFPSRSADGRDQLPQFRESEYWDEVAEWLIRATLKSTTLSTTSRIRALRCQFLHQTDTIYRGPAKRNILDHVDT